MKERKNFQEKKTEETTSTEITEGWIGLLKNWQEKLPPGILPEMVDLFFDKKGWRWHLKSEHIQDESQRKEYENGSGTRWP